MKVLSLFDGISCGMLALQRVGISAFALELPDIDTGKINETMHLLFSLEDAGLVKFTDDGSMVDTKDKEFRKRLLKWRKVHSQSLEKESYDEWRYSYEE